MGTWSRFMPPTRTTTARTVPHRLRRGETSPSDPSNASQPSEVSGGIAAGEDNKPDGWLHHLMTSVGSLLSETKRSKLTIKNKILSTNAANMKQVILRPLDRSYEEARKMLVHDFDVEACTDEGKADLLTCIEIGFVTVDAFNRLIRDLMLKALPELEMDDLTLAEAAAATLVEQVINDAVANALMATLDEQVMHNAPAIDERM